MRYFLIHAAVITLAISAAAYGRGGHDHDRGEGGSGHDSNVHETWDNPAGNHQSWCDVNRQCNGAGAHFTYGSQHPGYTSQVSLADFESRWRGRFGDNGPTTRTQIAPAAPAALPRGSALPHAYAAVRVPTPRPRAVAQARPHAPLDLFSLVVAEVTR